MVENSSSRRNDNTRRYQFPSLSLTDIHLNVDADDEISVSCDQCGKGQPQLQKYSQKFENSDENFVQTNTSFGTSRSVKSFSRKKQQTKRRSKTSSSLKQNTETGKRILPVKDFSNEITTTERSTVLSPSFCGNEIAQDFSEHQRKLLHENTSSRSLSCRCDVIHCHNEFSLHSCADYVGDCLTFAHKIRSTKPGSCTTFYDFHETLGGGRFGKVSRCVEKETGRQFAAKWLQCKKPTKLKQNVPKSDEDAPRFCPELEPMSKDDIMMEIFIMKHLDHPNIVKLYDVYDEGSSMTLILEYLDCGELFERVISDQSDLTELDAVLYTQQIADAVQYLHKNSILHLDLKPENILCTTQSSHHIKIIDFGLSRTFNPKLKLHVEWGTPEFMAPETLDSNVATSASDMWSVGVITYILLSGMSPFLAEDFNQTITNVINCDWDFEDPDFDLVTEEAKDFVSKLLVKDDSCRSTATECLRHEWLTAPFSGKERRKSTKKNLQEKNVSNLKIHFSILNVVNWMTEKAFEMRKMIRSAAFVEISRRTRTK